MILCLRLSVQAPMYTGVSRTHGWLLVPSEVVLLSMCLWSVLVRIRGSSLYIDKLVQGTHLFLKNFTKNHLSKSNPILYVSGSLST